MQWNRVIATGWENSKESALQISSYNKKFPDIYQCGGSPSAKSSVFQLQYRRTTRKEGPNVIVYIALDACVDWVNWCMIFNYPVRRYFDMSLTWEDHQQLRALALYSNFTLLITNFGRTCRMKTPNASKLLLAHLIDSKAPTTKCEISTKWFSSETYASNIFVSCQYYFKQEISLL